MRPACFLPLLLVLPAALRAQATDEGAGAAISYARTVSVPLNALLLHDKALEAWTWTFGKEPGARMLRANREQGLIEGTARVNFRSQALALREETMGVIQYRVLIASRAGECRITVSELNHTGNRGTARGGVHLGLLLRGDGPAGPVPGVGGGTARRIHAELKGVAEARILSLLQAFEARLRASSEP